MLPKPLMSCECMISGSTLIYHVFVSAEGRESEFILAT